MVCSVEAIGPSACEMPLSIFVRGLIGKAELLWFACPAWYDRPGVVVLANLACSSKGKEQSHCGPTGYKIYHSIWGGSWASTRRVWGP